jgi:hypothetical protein
MPKEPLSRWLPRTAGVELGRAQELNAMVATKNNNLPTDEAYYVSAAELAHKIIVLMQQGLDPLFLSTYTWALVQMNQCQTIN